MVAYALVGFLDRKTNDNFKRLWRDLSEKTLLNMGSKNISKNLMKIKIRFIFQVNGVLIVRLQVD